MSPITVKTVYGGDAESGHYSNVGTEKSRVTELEDVEVIAIVFAVLAYLISSYTVSTVHGGKKRGGER